MEVILFVDMLGGRRRWESGGVDESMAAFFYFKKLVSAACRLEGGDGVLDGIVETDAAALVCESTVVAARIARHLYRETFAPRRDSTLKRIWLRGCIVPFARGDFLRNGSVCSRTLNGVTAFRYSHSALEAVSVEKSGFKGMRLLVNRKLIDAELQFQTKIPFDSHHLIPISRLRYSYYPKRIADQYTDFLWMACNAEPEWYKLTLNMAGRLRLAARDPEELAQAAATQIVFHECTAIRQSVIGRAKRACQRASD